MSHWLKPGPLGPPKKVIPTDDVPPEVGDVVLCYWYDEDCAFVASFVGSGVYTDDNEEYPYVDVKRADGHILMVNPGDVRRLSDVK